MKKFNFKCYPSGDLECFTFVVDKKTFTEITGYKPDRYDKSRFHKNLYDLHPNHFFDSEEWVSIEVTINKQHE